MIIEKVSRSGVVLDHFQFNGSAIKIGRAYDNDLILHDIYVDAAHLRLTYDDENEGFWFEDLNSANGTQIIRSKDNKHQKMPATFISSGDTLCLGKTYLKVRSRVQDVPEAVKVSFWDKALSISGSIWCVTILCFLLLGLEILDQYITDPRMDKVGSKILESLNLLFIVVAYGVGWAFVARVQKAEPRLLVHASLAAWCILFFSVFNLIEPIIYFNWGSLKYAKTIDFLVTSTGVFIIVWASLYLATELKRALRFLLAALVPVGLLLSLIVNYIQRPEFIAYPEYDSIVVSPVWQWRAAISRDEFLKLTSELYVLPDIEDETDADTEEEAGLKTEIDTDPEHEPELHEPELVEPENIPAE